ncbi:MAG TPA: ATP-binding protein [Candidatus Aenigmarchaeota archaeon]|nr:ATP-binding protein [Candidatus Aenigmarchaeota archaeon]
MMRIGKIISIKESPNCEKFFFVAEKPDGIKKGRFVQIRTEEGLIIGRISNLIKTNRYLMNAEAVRSFGENLFNQFPIDRWEYLVAEVTPLGLFSNGEQKRVTFPPSPGQEVEDIDKDIIKSFFGFDENGLEIGEMETHKIKVKLNMSRLFQKHLAILAVSGAGKSHLASTLIEELLKKPISPSIVVIDPHGEYKSFSEDGEFYLKTKVFGKEQISINVSSLSSLNFSEFLPQMSSVQRRELEKIIQKLKEIKKKYDMNELIQAIELSEINYKTKSALISWLSTLHSTGLFSDLEKPTIEELAKVNQLSVIDLSEFIRLKDKQILVTHILRNLFDARRQGRIPPVILFIEEAHQFVPESKEKEFAISRGIIETIAREGRKFNFSLVLISQRPIKLSATALSQCNTFILLRIVNPYDIRHIMESCEAMTSDIANSLPGLKVGEAFITGEAINYPLLVKVRKRKTKENVELGLKVEEALKKFVEDSKKLKEDIEAFK